MYPNPAQNEITVTLNNGITLETATILDVNGRIVQSHKFNNLTQENIDISNLSAGVYFIKIQSNSGIGVKRIVKN